MQNLPNMFLLRTGKTVTNAVFLLFVSVVIATPTETVKDVETQVTNLQLLLSNPKDVCQGPIATSTPRKPGICEQLLCEERDSEDTLSAIESDSSDGESDVHSELNYSAGRGNPHVSIEEAVFDVQDTGTDDYSNDELTVDDIDDDMNVIEQQKCIAFVPCIVDLLKKSNGNICNRKDCKEALAYKTAFIGTAVIVTWTCHAGHPVGSWQSQPRVHDMFAGNLQIAACILLSGNSFAKIKLMFQFANIANISQTTFYRMQNLYLAPTIDHFWKTLQAELLSAYQGEKALLSGDGRNDSPGHSSQYLSYNVGDPEKKVIVHTEVVDVREVNGKSPNMERLGFERSMDQLQKNIVIDEMVTDAHSQIAAVMKKCDKFKGVKHSWDLWHGGKNIHKKVVKASQNKKCRDLLPWASTIRNHFWYSAKESKGSERKMKAIWFGILHHVVNEHEWLLNIDGTYGKCAHSPLTEENQQRPWLQKGSPAHVALKGIVEDKRFLRTFSYYVNFRHSGFVESFHSHLLMYAQRDMRTRLKSNTLSSPRGFILLPN
ncbi:uncharacterized protein [Ptychodera flava]|uniref:uncharacterized protein isoform X2 n=1 Tax=Ptychodera flava TaxID=63121 RepID=UPI003969E3B4